MEVKEEELTNKELEVEKKELEMERKRLIEERWKFEEIMRELFEEEQKMENEDTDSDDEEDVPDVDELFLSQHQRNRRALRLRRKAEEKAARHSQTDKSGITIEQVSEFGEAKR